MPDRIEPAREAPFQRKTQVSFVVRHQVKDGFASQYEAWLRQIMIRAAGYRGHLGVQVVRPPAGGHEYVAIVRFASQEDADRWASSADRRNLIQAVRELLEGNDEIEILSGIDFWFTPESPAQRRPVRWKQWLITTSVIWPLTMIVPAAFSPLFAHFPVFGKWGIGQGIVAATIVALVVYVIMPAYVKAVSGWLFRSG